MYHRIAKTDLDPWQLAVSPENFGEHLQVLKELNVISTASLVSSLAKKSIRSNSICVTFDDGYRDNYTQAKPLLEKYEIPATFFITSQAVGAETQFWWDELETILVEPKQLPKTLSINVNQTPFLFDLKTGLLSAGDREKQRNWKWPATPPTYRCDLYLKLWELLKPLPYPEIERVMKELNLWAGIKQPYNTNRVAMESNELSNLSAHPLFNLGVHTVTHPALAFHSKEIQKKEIVDSRSFLERSYGKRINTIAYPYGNYNNDTISIVKDGKFAAGFTTEEHVITNRSDTFRMGRFQVNNWNGETFERQVYMWLKKPLM